MSARTLALFLFLCCVPSTAIAAEGGPPTGGYGFVLVKMAFVLGGVCLLAWVGLRWGLRKFVTPGRDHSGAMEVLGRLPIEPRRSLVVVRVASKVLVLGSSEQGVERLAELEPDDCAAFVVPDDEGARPFADVLAALRPATVSRETSAAEEP